MIRIYKQNNNGNVTIVTNCTDPDQFIGQLATAMVTYVENRGSVEDYGDYQHDFTWLLSNGFEIAAKLRGYKADSVKEQRMLFAGDHWPDANETPDAEAYVRE